jgi:hypothetical protein
MNWFILLLIPLLALPVVLLYGFSGCASFSAADEPAGPPPTGTVTPTKPNKPIDLTAVAISTSTIRLTWKDTNGGGATYTVRRLRLDNNVQTDAVLGTETTHDDQGLTEGKTYLYHVIATLSGMSETSDPAFAKTLEWKKAIDNTALAATNDADHKGDCLVQRIDKATFTSSGSKVRVTLRAGSNDLLNLDLVTISVAAGAAASTTPNPWDSTAPVLSLGSGVLIAAGTSVLLGPVDFAIDKTKDIIIAFDIAATNGATRKVTGVAGTSAYLHNGIAQAKDADRAATGYNTETNTVYLIETVEVLSA